MVARGYRDIQQGELVDTYARSAFEDTRRKAKKYGAMGSTTRATKRARDRRVHSAAGGVGNLNGNVWTGNVVNAQDLDAALALAAKVGEAIRRPIEVWPFAGVAGA